MKQSDSHLSHLLKLFITGGTELFEDYVNMILAKTSYLIL